VVLLLTLPTSKYPLAQPGHAEAINITFNPSIIPYSVLLDIFWHTHNPTTLNQQGADRGPQYRSAIFYHSEEQRQQAEESKFKLEQEHAFPNPIVTKIEPFTVFYPAEKYHQDFYNINQGNGYCSVVIDPKVKKLLQLYKPLVKDEYQDE
jgi:peptide-methionine (S)-S-oxide reductase